MILWRISRINVHTDHSKDFGRNAKSFLELDSVLKKGRYRSISSIEIKNDEFIGEYERKESTS